MTACSCKVGSIRIEVDGSKHDGIYNFLAKGLGDTIRCVFVGGVFDTSVFTVPRFHWHGGGGVGGGCVCVNGYTLVVVDDLNVRSGYTTGDWPCHGWL